MLNNRVHLLDILTSIDGHPKLNGRSACPRPNLAHPPTRKIARMCGLALLLLLSVIRVQGQASGWSMDAGSSSPNAVGVIMAASGVEHPGNMPGARYDYASFLDQASGNFYVFGGVGTATDQGGAGRSLSFVVKQTDVNINSNGDVHCVCLHDFISATTVPALGDFWRYSTTRKLWAWIFGPITNDMTIGNCGTIGKASASNQPPARHSSTSYYDENSKNFYILGGMGCACDSCNGKSIC